MPLDLEAPVPKSVKPRSAPKSRATTKSVSTSPTRSTTTSKPKTAPKIVPKSTFDITSPPKSLPTMSDTAPSIENFDKKEEVKAKPLVSESPKPEVSISEAVQAEPVKTEPIKTEPIKTEPAKPEPSTAKIETVTRAESEPTVPEDKPEIKFGRKSRNPARAQKDAPAPEQAKEESEPKPKPESKSDDEKPMTFGRSKKKKA